MCFLNHPVVHKTFEKTRYMADTIMHSLGHVSPLILLTVIGLLTSFFTLVVSNVGATVLMIKPREIMKILFGKTDVYYQYIVIFPSRRRCQSSFNLLSSS